MIGMTVCSGIGAPEVAAPFIDWRYQSEIEAFPSAVLKARFPHAMNLGDMTKFKEWPDYAIDLLCGGTPCQSFSVAGLRKGMADPRGNLALVYLAIADRYRPEWLLWENVPGVLSSNGGRDFGAFLGGLAELGYGFAYRVLDAQFVRVESHPWAVPQRRRRVFVVGHLGDWRRAAAVLFERESLSGHPPPRREAGKDVAGTISSRPTGGGGLGTDFDLGGGLIAPDVSPAMKARDSKGPSSDGDGDGLPLVTHSLRASGFDASEDGSGRGTPIVPVAYRTAGDGAAYEEGDKSAPLTTSTDPNTQVLTLAIRGRGDSHDLEYRSDGTANAVLTPNGGRGGIDVGAVAFDTTQITSSQNYSNPKAGDPCHPLAATAHPPALTTQMAVRRLTPLECERLQGFPDGWTAIEVRGKPAADGPRYKSIGNSMACNVMNWLLTRIHENHHQIKSEAA